MKMFVKNYIIKAAIVVGLIGIDQITKYFLVSCDIALINGVIKFFYVENTGAGFGLFSGKTWLLICVTILLLCGMLVYDYYNKSKKGFYLVGISFVFAGAVGNFIDRIAFGYVRDFIKLEFIDFPVFNFADMCLTVGVILILIDLIFIKSPKNETNKGKI